MSRPLPLAGITVVELGHSVAAPYAAEILGDLGAEVIKIEKGEGDDARKWAPPYLGDMSATFQSLNRNKKSVVIDLSSERELTALKEFIVEKADVVVQNLRPGAARKYRIDAETLRSRKPSLVYCNIGAFGARGPLKDRPGYDPLMQAFAGLMSVTGERGQSPVRVGTSIVDMASGMWCAIGVLAALYQRKTTQVGAEIDLSLYETALAWMCYHAAGFQGSGRLPGRHGSGTEMIVPYRGYATSDGFIVVAAGNERLFALLARLLEHPEWIEDPRFRTNAARVENQAVLYAQIEAIIAIWPTAHWASLFDEAGLPNAPMQSIDEVLSHPQTAALDILQPAPDGQMSLLGLPLSFDGERPPFRRSPPTLGQHTDELLGEKKS
jgi:crotonobetainyl-CoA:carnitine CoA-transferase CaiB-like acyl-CoA transferase